MKILFISYLTLLSHLAFSQTIPINEIVEQTAQENPNYWEDETDIVKPTFTFDKTVLAKLERELASSDYYTDDNKTLYSGAKIVENKSMKISDGRYVKLSSIPEKENFVYVSQGENQLYLIRNIKTQELYVLHTFTMNYADYSSSSGPKKLIKETPIPLAPKMQELLSRYKLLIKNANANISVLVSIQKKYVTHGRFDEGRVNAVDKKTYNTNLSALKEKADKLAEIDRYEDKDDKAQDKLTPAELASLSNINDWNINQFKLN
jgi:hypothetical protein